MVSLNSSLLISIHSFIHIHVHIHVHIHIHSQFTRSYPFPPWALPNGDYQHLQYRERSTADLRIANNCLPWRHRQCDIRCHCIPKRPIGRHLRHWWPRGTWLRGLCGVWNKRSVVVCSETRENYGTKQQQQQHAIFFMYYSHKSYVPYTMFCAGITCRADEGDRGWKAVIEDERKSAQKSKTDFMMICCKKKWKEIEVFKKRETKRFSAYCER